MLWGSVGVCSDKAKCRVSWLVGGGCVICGVCRKRVHVVLVVSGCTAEVTLPSVVDKFFEVLIGSYCAQWNRPTGCQVICLVSGGCAVCGFCRKCVQVVLVVSCCRAEVTVPSVVDVCFGVLLRCAVRPTKCRVSWLVGRGYVVCGVCRKHVRVVLVVSRCRAEVTLPSVVDKCFEVFIRKLLCPMRQTNCYFQMSRWLVRGDCSMCGVCGQRVRLVLVVGRCRTEVMVLFVVDICFVGFIRELLCPVRQTNCYFQMSS